MITISVRENENRLFLDEDVEPIVCGNSNYELEFEFSAEWKDAEHKIAVFEVCGERFFANIVENKVKIPVLPNARSLIVSVISAKDTESQLATTPIVLELTDSYIADNIPETEQNTTFLAEILGTLNGIKTGAIVAKTALVAENVCNANMLVNGDFSVNQRGSETYAFDKVGGYFSDRWFSGSGQSWTINSDTTITQTNTSGQKNRWFCQWIEDYKKILGKTITISMKVKDAIAGKEYKLGVYDGTSVTGISGIYKEDGEQIVSVTFSVPESVSGTKLGVIAYPRNEMVQDAKITVCYVKMELGEHATKFVPKSYAEELALCHRYYQNIRISGNAITASSTSKLYPSVPIAVPMRAKGTLTVKTMPYIRRNEQNIQASSVVLNTIYDNCVVLEISRTQADLIASALYVMANGQAVIDAEIY